MESATDNSALDVVQQRYTQGSSPKERSDNHIVIAVFEPGAMRTITVASQAAAIELLGRRDSFDIVGGSSSGAMIAACLAARQTEEMLRTFLFDVRQPEVVNLGRIFRGNIVDIRFLVEKILRRPDNGLSWQAVRDSDIPLKVLARSARRGDAVVFDQFETEEDFFGALAASAWMPRVAGWRPYEHKGHRYWDLMDNGLEELVLAGMTHAVLFKSSSRRSRYSRTVLTSKVNIDEIRPSKTIRRLETRLPTLKDAVRYGALAVFEAFQPTESELNRVRERYESLGVVL